MPTPDPSIHPLESQVTKLRQSLSQWGVDAVRERLGSVVQCQGDMLILTYWQRQVQILFPDLVVTDRDHGQPLPMLDQAMVMYYLHDSNGLPAAGQWIAFSELPEGRFYNQAFQGYTGQKLAHAFGDDLDALRRAVRIHHGLPVQIGSTGFAFTALPSVPLCLACWLGDEDFPPSYRILFDANVHHHLRTDSCAILGSMLTSRLLSTFHHSVNPSS